MIEKSIGYHCGPALAGIKPSNLIALYKDKCPNASEEIKRLNNELNHKDIYIEILCECNSRFLVLVYRKKVLEANIQKEDIKPLLHSFGYAQNLELSSCIDKLKTRILGSSFPHEIGAFLGYPAKDINGFIDNKGDKCLYVGEWKVYDNVEFAKKLFQRYKVCRNAIVRRIENGDTLAKIFCAA